jgi:hypothetical protein
LSAASAPGSPSHIARDDSSFAVMLMMMSAFCAASRGEATRRAPSFTRAAARSAVRL